MRLANSFSLALPAIIIAAGVLLPFAHGAYRIDDPYFLLLAQHTRVEPSQPLNFELCWFPLPNYSCGPASRLAPGASLMGYFLLPLTWLGYQEAAAHAMQFVLLCIAIWFTVRLALGWGLGKRAACVAGLIVATTPLVLGVRDTVLPDLLAMTLAVCGMERYFKWMKDENTPAGATAALLLGLAPLARAHLLLVIAVAAIAAAGPLYDKTCSARVRLGVCLPLIGACIIFAAITLLTRSRGTDGVLPPGGHMSLGNILVNLMVFPLYLVFPFQIGLVWAILKGKAIRQTVYVTGVTGIIAHLLTKNVAQSLLVCSVLLGGIFIFQIAIAAGRSRNWIYVTCVAWLLVPLAALPYFQFPPKYLIASAPGAAILIAWLFDSRPGTFQQRTLLAIVSLSLVASVLILRADVGFAELPRLAASELIAPRVQRGERVWFTGEWGIYWYAQRAGASVLIPGVSSPRAGDLMLTGDQESRNGVINGFPKRSLVQEKAFSWSGGRVMSAKDMAGLYTTGRLAWAWGSGEVNRYQLWRLE